MSDPNFALYPITVPVGAIIAFAGEVASFSQTNSDPFTTQPIECFGWMLCDGSPISANQYPELYAALGKLYGSTKTDNDIMFNLPDLRGQFLRGIGIDDASTEKRTKAVNGKDNGVGSVQKDALQTHVHMYSEPTGAAPGNSGPAFAAVNPNALTGIPTNEPSSPAVNVSQFETRPTNIFVNYLIKYTYKLPIAVANLEFTPPNY